MQRFFRSNSLNVLKELDGLTLLERCIVGLGAFVASVGAAFFGVLVSVATIKGRIQWILAVIGLGGGLLAVSAFMLLVWLRLWFGARPWLDSTIERLFWKVYVYLPLSVLILIIWSRSVLQK